MESPSYPKPSRGMKVSFVVAIFVSSLALLLSCINIVILVKLPLSYLWVEIFLTVWLTFVSFMILFMNLTSFHTLWSHLTCVRSAPFKPCQCRRHSAGRWHQSIIQMFLCLPLWLLQLILFCLDAPDKATISSGQAMVEYLASIMIFLSMITHVIHELILNTSQARRFFQFNGCKYPSSYVREYDSQPSQPSVPSSTRMTLPALMCQKTTLLGHQPNETSGANKRSILWPQHQRTRSQSYDLLDAFGPSRAQPIMPSRIYLPPIEVSTTLNWRPANAKDVGNPRRAHSISVSGKRVSSCGPLENVKRSATVTGRSSAYNSKFRESEADKLPQSEADAAGQTTIKEMLSAPVTKNNDDTEPCHKTEPATISSSSSQESLSLSWATTTENSILSSPNVSILPSFPLSTYSPRPLRGYHGHKNSIITIPKPGLDPKVPPLPKLPEETTLNKSIKRSPAPVQGQQMPRDQSTTHQNQPSTPKNRSPLSSGSGSITHAPPMSISCSSESIEDSPCPRHRQHLTQPRSILRNASPTPARSSDSCSMPNSPNASSEVPQKAGLTSVQTNKLPWIRRKRSHNGSLPSRKPSLLSQMSLNSLRPYARTPKVFQRTSASSSSEDVVEDEGPAEPPIVQRLRISSEYAPGRDKRRWSKKAVERSSPGASPLTDSRKGKDKEDKETRPRSDSGFGGTPVSAKGSAVGRVLSVRAVGPTIFEPPSTAASKQSDYSTAVQSTTDSFYDF